MNLLLLESHELDADTHVRLSGPRADHLIRILKVTPGASVRVGIIDGPVGEGIVADVAAGTVDLRCRFGTDVPARPTVDLLLALPRPKVLRRLWPQLAALGVGRIILTNASRVERVYFDTHVLTEACYRALLVEGLQQARDTRLPLVSVHRQFRKLIEDELDPLAPAAARLVAHPDSDRDVTVAIERASCRRQAPAPETADPGSGDPGNRQMPTPHAGPVLLAIGPEGGWNEFELALLGAHRFEAISMGPRTLRTDTATIALLALVHDALSKERAARLSLGFHQS
ncbi:MAG: RsmE family RNA methyltransferase [Vicinamibacterales bacterium]